MSHCNPVGAPFSATVNQDRAQITGGEAEIEFRSLRRVTDTGSVGLNKYESFPLAAF